MADLGCILSVGIDLDFDKMCILYTVNLRHEFVGV